MNYDTFLVKDPELFELQRESEELNEFIQTEILPLKAAYRCYGMESVDYRDLAGRITSLINDSQECLNEFSELRKSDGRWNSPLWREQFMSDYYVNHPDVFQLSKNLKEQVDSMSIQNCHMHQYLLERDMDLFYLVLNSLFRFIEINGVQYYDLTKPLLQQQDDYDFFYVALKKLISIQNTFYRYESPSEERYRFIKFDDLLNSILARNEYILSAYKLRDLIQISPELAKQRNQVDMATLTNYLNMFLDTS